MAEDIIRCTLTAESLEAIRQFAKETDADLGCRPVAKRTETGFQIDAYLPKGTFDRAQSERSELEIKFVENFSETSRERRAEVSQSNRYENRASVPHGLGVKE